MAEIKYTGSLQNTYAEITGAENDFCDDYRSRMLESNDISVFLNKSERCIDGVKKQYYETTGMETIANRFHSKDAQRDDLLNLFKAMAEATKEAENILIEEGNIIFRPDFIFYNPVSDDYKFICIPVKEPEKRKNENIKSLMQFFLQRMDENDITLLKTIYSLFDRLESGTLNSLIIYETLKRELKEADYGQEAVKIPSPVKLASSKKIERAFYIPSIKEVLALLCTGLGVFIIGYQTYLMLL